MKSRLLVLLCIFQYTHLFGQSCSPDSLINRSIKAFETDSNIDWEIQNHQVFLNPDCIPNNKLVIHLVGSFDNPANTTYFPTLAANSGFKAINLKYPNGTAIVTACGSSDNSDCFEQLREEVIYGTDASDEVEVNADNCIINRIEKLLLHLVANYPAENWESFITETGIINWSNIIVSGHSQGGGHAAFIAKMHEVNRVLMFASPNDYSNFFEEPASWTANTSLTNATNYFAFGSLFDDVIAFNKQFQVWNELNLFSITDSTNVDNTACNFNNSQALYTGIHNPSDPFSTCHNSVIIDEYTPIVDGTPIYTPIWEYMLGVCEFSTLEESPNINVNVNLFPNPTTAKIQIESNTEILKIEVYNQAGILVKIIEPLKHQFELNLLSYKGLLLLNITLKGATNPVSKKIMVL